MEYLATVEMSYHTNEHLLATVGADSSSCKLLHLTASSVYTCECSHQKCGLVCVFLFCRGIVVVFISTSLLLVVASASYGLATGVQKVCNDLQPPDYTLFREVADNPSVWGGYTLVGVITRETVSRTVNLSISHLLRSALHVVYYSLDELSLSLHTVNVARMSQYGKHWMVMMYLT